MKNEIMRLAESYAEKMMGVANYVKSDAHIEARAALEAAVEKDAEYIEVLKKEVIFQSNEASKAQREKRELRAELEAAQMALRSALYLIDENKLNCHNLHHSQKDFHEWDQPCGVEVKAKQRLASIHAAIDVAMGATK